jgi:hypothetical protein
MKGFEIKFKGKTIYASVDKGFVAVIISFHKETINFYIGGYNKSNCITWYSGIVDEIDEIIVKVVDVTQTTEPIETVSKDVQHYNLLKYELTREGLI